MTTTTQVREAERLSRRQRATAQPFLQLDQAKATPRETEIYARAKAATDFDIVLATQEVNEMFCRGVLFFALPASN